ncbi:MAG: hypothetical protein QG549_829 [Patescibacteria group bacterium]|nr:hypothetical protein [Patescibacteria group bacterium]
MAKDIRDIRNLKAYLALTEKEKAKRATRLQKVQHGVEEQAAKERLPHLYLAVQVTDYVATSNGAIWADNIEKLYEELADELLRDVSETAKRRIINAVAYACSSEWLERHDDNARCAYSVPRLKPNREPAVPKKATLLLAA